ncbi:MAG: hypothetical protein GWO20_04350, partial [Candidatus Korarchaeota archaeon]|nr:hypothetical protein [Candidatus Korarchaeota archaeon]
VTEDGFYKSILVEAAWESGEYTVSGSYTGKQIGTIVFFIGERQPEKSAEEEACPTGNCVSVAPKEEKKKPSVATDVDWYRPLMVNISGEVTDIQQDQHVTVKIIRPDKTSEEMKV